MRVAVYDKIEHASLFPNDQIVEVNSSSEGQRSAAAGNADAFITSSPTTAAQYSGQPVALKYLMMLTNRIQTTPDLANKVVGTSVDERDLLPSLLLAAGVQQTNLADVQIVPCQTYVSNATCVDIYITSVLPQSATLSSITSPFAAAGISGGTSADYNIQEYKNALNVASLTCGTKMLWLCRA